MSVTSWRTMDDDMDFDGFLSTINHGLINTYRISVHPVALGSGKPLFEDLKESINLNLVKVNIFKSGVVQLLYEPKK